MCSSSGFFHARLTCDLFVQLGSTKKAQDINNSWQLRCCLCCCSGSRQRWSVGRYRGGRWACSRGLGEDSLQRGRPAQRVRCAAASSVIALSLLQISSRAGRPLANANGRRQGGRRCCAAGSSRGSSQRLLFLHIRLPFSPSTALCPQLSHPWIPPHFPNTARSGRDSSFTLVE